jgi:membrane protein DedA with SNARE-associated domain
MAGDDPTLDASSRRRPPSRHAVAAVTLPLVALVVMGYIGDALAPSLVDTHPAWLIALNARNRNLILVTNYLDAWTFYSIGIVRLLLSDPLFFILGYWYGDAAVAWMERRTRTWGQLARQAEGWFSKAAYPIVFIAPNNFICLFAGAAGMPIRAFFAVNVAGTVFRLWLIRRFGEAFESPIDDVVGWIGEYRIPLLILSVVLVVISISLEAKRGETEVTALTRLEDEIDEIEDEIDHGEHGDGPEAAEVAGAAGAEGAAEAAAPDDPGAQRPEARDEPDG